MHAAQCTYSIVEVQEDKKDSVSSELTVPVLILHQCKLTTKRKLFAVFRIGIVFNADLDQDPAFKLK
jgi:hypothetical protein